MDTALHRRDIAHRPWAQMLITFGCAIACRMRHANKGNIRMGEILISDIKMRTAEQGGNPPPIKVVHHAGIMFIRHNSPLFRI